jgi:nitric oxide reductase NorQ protein
MVAIELDFPPPDIEEKIVSHESGIDHQQAAKLVQLAQAIRRLQTAGLREVASTRVLIAAARLAVDGIPIATAARAAVAGPLTDDPAIGAGLQEMIATYLASSH